MNKAMLACAVVFVFGTAARAEEAKHEHDHAPKAGSKEFERMKQLVGTWKGSGDMDGKKMDAVVNYRLTSAGTVLLETMGPGTDHEMVTAYHDEGGKLAMTHYCAMGNQPHM